VLDSAPTWQTVRKSTVEGVGGADRIDTAVDASRLGYDTPEADGTGQNGGHVAKAVVLSRSDTFADALAGSAPAGHLGGRLLLSPTASLALPDRRRGRHARNHGAALERRGAVGGHRRVSGIPRRPGHAVGRDRGQGVAVLRIRFRADRVRSAAGPDRFATAAVAQTLFTAGNAPHVVSLATGSDDGVPPEAGSDFPIVCASRSGSVFAAAGDRRSGRRSRRRSSWTSVDTVGRDGQRTGWGSRRLGFPPASQPET
jgi:hypothetical protein